MYFSQSGEAREHPVPVRALQPRAELEDGAEDAHGDQARNHQALRLRTVRGLLRTTVTPHRAHERQVCLQTQSCQLRDVT